MGLIITDAALRGAALSLFLLLSVMFGASWRQSLTAKLGTILTLAGAAYVSLLALDYQFGWPWWRFPLHALSLSAPPLFWLFASSWFDDEFELRVWHIAAVVVVVTFGLLGNFLYSVERIATPIGTVWRISSIVCVLLGLRASLKGRGADLVESRRRVRLALAVVVAIVILWVVVAEIGVASWPPPDSWRVTNAFGMLVLAVAVALSTLGWRDATLLAAPPKPVAVAIRGQFDDAPLLTRLEADMRRERLYRQDGLTITAVAARLGVPEYRLRRAINHGLGARNFNAYLNGFRLEEAEAALGDPAQREVPILTIAMDAGFGSLAPFNRAFRDRHGCTPSEFRARP